VIPFVLIRITAYAIAAIVATLVLGTISSRLVSFDTASTVLLFGLVIGVINAFIKPVVALLSLPITCLTFGLFALVINTVLFYFGATLTPGMDVSWWGALFGSLLASIASGLMFSVVDE
jgi:putative membrane protein